MKDNWDIEIKPKKNLFLLNLKELLSYYDLLVLFVKRDLKVLYKQTILGPLWFFLQPVLTTTVFVIVFGNIAEIPTDGLPKPLFYMSGIIIWNFFSDCFVSTSNTFGANASLFGKVYFPRLIKPLSVIISNGLKFLIQLVLFVSIYLYYALSGVPIEPNSMIFLFPLLIIIMSMTGLGLGLIFSSLTTKYRDLRFLIQFGVQLMMYTTPIIYPLSTIPEKYRIIIKLNPLSHIIEGFKYSILGEGNISLMGFLYSIVFAFTILFLGVLVFNKTEKNFMDTV